MLWILCCLYNEGSGTNNCTNTGYLSPIALEVHMPVDPKALSKAYSTQEKIPFAFDDPRYVHHAWEDGKWFGRASEGKLVYALQDRTIDLAQVAP